MVVLNRIYTRTGDKGETALGDGTRVPKPSLRVEAYGTVDETNATVGLARLHADGDMDVALARIQNDLFDLGADLCRPNPDKDGEALGDGATEKLLQQEQEMRGQRDAARTDLRAAKAELQTEQAEARCNSSATMRSARI